MDRAYVHTHRHRATSLQLLQTSLCKNGEGALHIPAGLAAVSELEINVLKLFGISCKDLVLFAAEPVFFLPLYSCILRCYNFLNSRSFAIEKIS